MFRDELQIAPRRRLLDLKGDFPATARRRRAKPPISKLCASRWAISASPAATHSRSRSTSSMAALLELLQGLSGEFRIAQASGEQRLTSIGASTVAASGGAGGFCCRRWHRRRKFWLAPENGSWRTSSAASIGLLT